MIWQHFIVAKQQTTPPTIKIWDVYLKPKVTLQFELSNISLLLLSLTKLNIAMSCWFPPCPNSRKTT